VRNERGFSLIETVVAVAVAVLLGYALLYVFGGALRVSSVQVQRDAEASAIGALSAKLTDEEDDAWAIFTPPADVLGAQNADGHEVDFFTRDGKQKNYFWAYRYDAPSKTVTRYLYAMPGGTVTKDFTYGGITKFTAHTYPLTALQDPTTPVYSALYTGAHLQNGAVPFFSGAPWIAGGNQITDVQFAGATISRDVQLVTQTAPSGFTIVLHYTPAPSPTPQIGALQTDPGYILFMRSPVAIGAPSSGSCAAYAYTADPSTGGTLELSDGKIGSDSTGCMNGPNGANVYVSQAGNTGGFNVEPGGCSGYVSFGRFSAPISPSDLPLGLGTSPPGGSCQFFIDGEVVGTPPPRPSAGSGLVNATVACESVQPYFVPLGASCEITVPIGGPTWVACDGDGSTYFAPGAAGTDGAAQLVVAPGSIGSG
jgi:type II secretory pathway pseudopilin PulG